MPAHYFLFTFSALESVKGSHATHPLQPETPAPDASGQLRKVVQLLENQSPGKQTPSTKGREILTVAILATKELGP